MAKRADAPSRGGRFPRTGSRSEWTARSTSWSWATPPSGTRAGLGALHGVSPSRDREARPRPGGGASRGDAEGLTQAHQRDRHRAGLLVRRLPLDQDRALVLAAHEAGPALPRVV